MLFVLCFITAVQSDSHRFMKLFNLQENRSNQAKVLTTDTNEALASSLCKFLLDTEWIQYFCREEY